MSEPREQASPPADAGEYGELLATKLFAPRPRPGFVSRPRLVRELDEGLARGLVLVSAPAGSGKTTLLAEWAQQRRVAWLSLDASDNDPVRFWRHAVAALDRARPGVAQRILPQLGPPPPSSFEGLVTTLINELAAEPDQSEIVLVLDDDHEINSLAVHDSLAFLLKHRPETLRMVLAGRVDPPLPLAQLRARGQLAELRIATLRFTPEEAASLLREAIGPSSALSDASADELTTRTEGWAAGLQLAALSLRGSPDLAGSLATFSSGHRFVFDYLAEEVLERQPEQVRAFLLDTSVLERLSGPLCNAVTGRADGAAMLEAIERANLFLEPLDEVRGWWRYHQLFADLLRARLRQQRPERAAALHRSAAGWYERNGFPNDAIHHAFAAGDVASAARMIERHVDALLVRSERVTLERWLAALPSDVVKLRPRLLLAQADMALSSGRLEAAADALDAAEQAFAAIPDASHQPSAGRSAGLVANVPAAIAFWRAYLAELGGDAERAIALDHRALAALGEGESVLTSAVRLHLRAVELLKDVLPGVVPRCEALVDAERAFAASMTELRAAGETYLALRACELLGHIQRAQGRLEASLETYWQGLDIAAPTGRPPLPAAGAAYVGLAEVAYQRGELDVAMERANAGVALSRQLAYPRPLAAGLAVLARIRQANGDLSAAFDVLDGYRQGAPTVGALVSGAGRERPRPSAAPSRGVTGLLDPVPALRARLLLARGDLAGALRWVQERGVIGENEVSYPREPDFLVLARVLLAQDLPDQSLELLDRLSALAVAQGRTGSVIEIQALRAVAFLAASDQTAALAVLAETLTLAYPQGYVQVFVDEGAPMRTLLGRLVAAQRRDRDPLLGYVSTLLAAFERGAAPGASSMGLGGASMPGLIEALSGRELEVLRLLAAGKQNREIAGELYVTVDTVKKHVTHIFEKLGVVNRTQATARARELGFLDNAPNSSPSNRA
jgi:LuxR family maltose regulon positive regulatory protein